MILILECIVCCFILLVPCVVVIANGAHNGVFLYEKDVQERVVRMGLITEHEIARNAKWFKIVTMIVLIGFVIWAVYVINGARGFMTPFLQIYAMAMAEGLFDRFFIDAYWVGHTNAWTIPGTEDLKPYIPKKTLIIKWLTVIVGNSIIAAVLAGLMMFIFK